MFEKSFRVARRTLGVSGALVAALSAASSCSRQTVTVQLHPLQASGDVTYVCRTPNGSPRALADCNPAAIARGELDLYALVTQTATGEVAVINVPNDPASIHSGEGIVDVDPTAPGYGFLHVGGLPSRIVSTPGGSLSIVGVTEAGKPGLFGLPTQCIGAPTRNQDNAAGTDRDLTSWPACSLPSAPGSLAVILAPESDTLCDGSPNTRAESATDNGCLAAVGTPAGEAGPKGRRKIVVTLPERGSIAVIDAEWFAQGAPGEFGQCLIEKEFPLAGAMTSASQVTQILPPDLDSDKQCLWGGTAPNASFNARPAGIAVDKNTLYVADSEAPVIHVVDLSNPCAPVEKDPLLTRSVERPERIVTTSRVAVSPLTPAGRQFVYAIDEYDTPTASIMAFDVSPGATDRTPIVRPGAPLILSEPPDRILLPAAPRDVQFFERDRPVIDPATGNVAQGLACDPTPGNTGIGAQYRSVPDYTSGARAVELRGVFGAALLTSGQVAIIDVEDFDAPCRRPMWTNTDASVEDFRGCKGDPALQTLGGLFIDSNGFRTVTDEVSCRMVEPHRARAASLGLTDATRGIHAPSLRGFPQLRLPEDAQQYTVEDKPKLLAVDFSLQKASTPPTTLNPGAAQVYVGTGLYSSQSVDNALEVAPATAQRNSVALPFNEPRAYPSSDTLSLTYEGALTELLPAGFLRTDDPNSPFKATGLTLHDPSIGFCDRGVNDEQLMAQLASDRFGITEAAEQNEFARQHADYVVLMGEFPDADDPYWQGADESCGRNACIQTFGDYDPTLASKEPNAEREFRIVDALHQWLKLTPRGGENPELEKMAACCFPSGASYVVRASNQWLLRGTATGVRHQVRATWVHDEEKYKGDQLDCTNDCNPRRRYAQSRVFEICSPDAPEGACVCSIADATRGVTAGEAAESCIYSSPTARFAVYRGRSASVRDMVFNWQTIGGFSPMRIDFSALSSQVSPTALVGLPEFNWLTVVDGASLGLVLLSLDNLAPLAPPLN